MNDCELHRLADGTCEPCHGGAPPLTGDELRRLAGQLPEWRVVRSHHVTRIFDFPDFRQALDFVNQAGEVAEQQGHHPDIELTWGKVDVKIFTHKIQGLTESDFILAAKIERIYDRWASSTARR